MTEDFGARLDAVLSARGSLCVGIDPHPALLNQWGMSSDADGLARFADVCVRAFAGLVPAVKPQSAFFEVFGAAGIAVLERTLAAIRSSGAIALLDVKRGDIGSTMDAYARAYLDPAAPLAADAITVSPYLGVGSLQPAFDVAAEHARGVFVLGLTSNPEGPQVQRAVGQDGRPVAQVVADEVAVRNAGAAPVGSFGLVVGATVGSVEDAGADDPAPVDLGAVNGPFLVPGVGAQGGTAADVRAIFGTGSRYVLPSVSREVLRHGPDVSALRAAAEALIAEFTFLRP